MADSKADEARRLAQSALGRANVLTGDTELEKLCAVVEAMADEIDSLRAEVAGLRAQNDCYDEQLERWTLRVRRRNEELEKLRAELEAYRAAFGPLIVGAESVKCLSCSRLIAEREEWANAIRTVAPGYVASAHAAKHAISELFEKFKKEQTKAEQYKTRIAELEATAKLWADREGSATNYAIQRDADLLSRDQEIERLKATIAQLTRALKPFAKAAEETDFSERGRVKNSWWFDDAVIKRAGKVYRAALDAAHTLEKE